MNPADTPLLHRIQVNIGDEMRREWTDANYAATFLNPAVPADARLDAFMAAQGGCCS